MSQLQGKLALVTGGTRGIGRAIALSLAAQGANVAINYQSSKEAADEVVGLIEKMGVKARAYQANVGSEEQANIMCEKLLSDLGPTSVLVNCAGITRDRSFVKMTRGDWDEVINVNLNGPFTITKAVLPPMLQTGWGRIINISSIVGQWGNFGQANYAATKGGLIAFTQTLARELARKNITVNAVAPGFIDTDMTKGIPDAAKQAVCAATPMGRFGKAEEIAAAVEFLASPKASYITGQVIAVNGGMYM